ncbi:MAG: transglycosylase domain-containing protein, partial [Spirochaetota bacterium]|nr:transglycosylase domain-containing protein [Spirochaetota bacterium]
EKITEFFIKKRAIVPYHRLPQNLINALIAMEDTRFYQHKGVDSYRIAGAMVQNIITSIKRGKWTVVQGGSTVTQQLAKLLFTSRERTFGRKIVELWMTLQIEKRFTKPEILEKYFNQIYFNHGVYGVEMASQFYFGKKVEDISLAECAMLVSIPPAPERYSPFRNPDNARKKQKLVLKKMVDMGFATKEEAAESITLFWDEMNERLVTKEIRSALHNRVDEAPYFSEYVRLFVEKSLKKSLKGMVEEDLLKENRKMSAEELEDEVEKRIRDLFFTGGFKVYTTLDLRKQRAARKHLKDQLEIQDKEFRHQSRWVYHGIRNNYSDMASLIGLSMANPDFQFHYKRMQKETLTEIRKELNAMSVIANTFGLDNVNRLVKKHSDEMEERNLSLKTEGALISMNPNTGHIVSMVGGRKFSEKNRLNRVVDIKRQPGSAFKAFVYGAAINSKSLTPSSVLVDEELKFFDVVNQIYWTPGNADQEYLGPIPLRTALKLSVNTIAVKIVNRIGAKAVVNFVTPIFGLKPERFRDDTSIALGTSELTPFEMCEAISVYANGGRKIKPVAVLRVMDRHGREIYTAPKNKSWNYVVSPQVAFLITDMLKGVVTSGTASGAVGEAGFHRECAGKTGSTQDSKDAWFVGYTPNLATVVWIGFDRGGISLGRNQFGGTVAAP